MILKEQDSVVVVWVTIVDHWYCSLYWLQKNYESVHHRNDDVVAVAVAADVAVAYALYWMACTRCRVVFKGSTPKDEAISRLLIMPLELFNGRSYDTFAVRSSSGCVEGYSRIDLVWYCGTMVKDTKRKRIRSRMRHSERKKKRTP